MLRPPRLRYPGAIYYLVTRGVGLLLDTKSRPSQICAVVCRIGFRDMRTGTPNEIDGLLQRCENCSIDLD